MASSRAPLPSPAAAGLAGAAAAGGGGGGAAAGAAGAAAALALAIGGAAGAPGAALASEYDILAAPRPADGRKYLYDDAKMFSRATVGALQKRLQAIEKDTGYHLNIVTLRKLLSETDAYVYADKVLETWYPTRSEGDKKGVLVLVSTPADGGISAGPGFLQTVGDDTLEGVMTENVPYFGKDEKWNEATTTSVNRLAARLNGEADPGPPEMQKKGPGRRGQANFQTKKQTTKKKANYTFIVGSLLVIAFVVPMAQLFAGQR